MSFDYLKDREISGRSSWLAVPQVSDNAMIKLIPAGDANPAYQNGLLRLAAARQRSMGAGERLGVRDADQSREDDRTLYPEFVVQDWSGIEDNDGQDVPFSREKAAEFFAMLPAWIFDRIRLFAMIPENFLKPREKKIRTADVVGNSGGG